MNHKNSNKQKFIFDLSSPKDILTSLLIGGALVAGIAAPALIAPAIFLAKFYKDKNKRRKFQNSFYYLKKNGLISVKNEKGLVTVNLTEKGKMKARKHQITTHIKKSPIPSSWDGKWHIVIFDISASRKVVRDALRTMIKRVGMVQLQKSVWLYPFDCSAEVEFLKNFFSLGDKEIRIIHATNIGNDAYFKKIFKIKL